MSILYKTRLDIRKKRANRLGNCFYHTTNKGQTLRLPFAKTILDSIELQKKRDGQQEK